MKITIQGELTDLNTYIKAERTNRFLGSKIKKQETERVAWQVKGSKKPTNFPLHIHYDWYSKNARKDIDNISFSKKFLQDGLVLGGVIPDDSRKYISGMSERFFIDKNNPRVELWITSAS